MTLEAPPLPVDKCIEIAIDQPASAPAPVRHFGIADYISIPAPRQYSPEFRCLHLHVFSDKYKKFFGTETNLPGFEPSPLSPDRIEMYQFSFRLPRRRGWYLEGNADRSKHIRVSKLWRSKPTLNFLWFYGPCEVTIHGINQVQFFIKSFTVLAGLLTIPSTPITVLRCCWCWKKSKIPR